MPSNRIVFLLPGIFGSSISMSGSDIWGSNFFANYTLIADNPAAIAWNGTQGAASLMQEARVQPPYFPFAIYKQQLWSEIINVIHTHSSYGPSVTFAIGYDWRDSLLNSATSFATVVNTTLEKYSTDERAKAVFVTHSMGGLLTRVAIGGGQIAPDDIDRIVHIGTPLLGAPSAFSSLYGQLRFPFLRTFLWMTHGKRAVRFRENLFECVRTFQSAWELLPHDAVQYIRHQGTVRNVNPLSGTIIDPVHVTRVRQVHQLVDQSDGLLVGARVPVHKIYTASHQIPTEFQYEVGISSTATGDLKYDLVAPPIENSNGDGTVPNTSAWGNRVNAYPVIDVSHVEMCNHSRVAKILWGLL
jgi:hypothetical protein